MPVSREAEVLETNVDKPLTTARKSLNNACKLSEWLAFFNR